MSKAPISFKINGVETGAGSYQEGKMNDTYGKPAGDEIPPKPDPGEKDEASHGVPMACFNSQCPEYENVIEVSANHYRIGVSCVTCDAPLSLTTEALMPDEKKPDERDQQDWIPDEDPEAEAIAKAFHAAYEKLAPRFSYETRKASAVAWDDVPLANKALMTATVRELLRDDVIVKGESYDTWDARA